MTSSSLSSHQAPAEHYDVFISFKGEDTRRNFADHLYSVLSHERIKTFFDDEFSTEDKIFSSILRAIEGSTISIIIFSEHYAGSKMCLMELEKILECKRSNGQMVIPVFYGVDPSHVRNQTGCFGAAFARLEERLREEETMDLDKIRYNLRKAGSMSGWLTSDFGYELYMVKGIVGDVLNKLSQGKVGILSAWWDSESRDAIKIMEVLNWLTLDYKALNFPRIPPSHLHPHPQLQAGIFTHLVQIILGNNISHLLENVLIHLRWFKKELMTLADEIHEVEGLSSHDARQLITMPSLGEMACSIIDDENRRRVYRWSPQIPPKMVSNWMLPLTNLVLEILQLTLDQIASAQKPLYGLMGLVVACSALLVCVGELVYKGWTGKNTLKQQGMRWCWIQYPWSVGRPLFSWLDVFSLACAIVQIVFSSFGYSCLQQNKENPIKVSMVLFIYIICLFFAKISKEGLPVCICQKKTIHWI